MKLKNILKIIFAFVFVSVCLLLNENVQALTQEEAGQYFAQFAINFFDNYADQTNYSTSNRSLAVTYGKKGSNDKYNFDCVGWVSFAIYQSTKLQRGVLSHGFRFYAQPDGVGTKYAGQRGNYFDGFTQIYGAIASRRKIPLETLRNILRPGDLLMSCSCHVLLYVGNDEVIHCTGHGPGPSYGGDLGYGLRREKLSEYSKGFESVGRITPEAAASIDPANATTIFNGQGGINSNWIDGVGSVSGGQGTTTNRVVSPDDKLPLYKHILLTEKYNFNEIKWEKYGHGYAGSPCEMTADVNLGLTYPQDQSNTNLNSFIDFTFPYLQNWLVPLAMHSGLMANSNNEKNSKSANFAYSVLKDAMSDITVNRYDISKCELKTRYKEYDVVTYEKKYSIYYDTWDKERKYPNYKLIQDYTETNREHVNTRLDSSGNVNPMLEEYVSKNVTVTPEYYIKEANMFDVRISNVFNYIQYNDNDVENRRENTQGFTGTSIAVGEAVNSDQYGQEDFIDGGIRYVRYKVNIGNYKYATRTWEDTLEQTGDTSITDYTYSDVKEYNNVYGDVSLSNIEKDDLNSKILDVIPTGDSNLENLRWLFPYAIAASIQTNGKILPSVLVAQAVQEGGFTNIAAAKEKLDNPKAKSLTMDRNKSLFNQKTIAGYSGTYPSIETTGTIVQIEAYANKLATDTSSIAFENAREIASTEITSGVEEDYKERIKSVLTELGAEYLENTESSKETYKNTVFNIVETYNLHKLDMLYDDIKGNTKITIKDVEDQEKKNDINEFTYEDENYYRFLIESGSKINRIDIMNSKPANYLTYMKKEEKYANHVGFSRSFLTLSYDELKTLFKDYFSSGTLPFFWGASLGYKTYTGINDLKASSYNSLNGSTNTNFGDLTGTGIEIGTSLDSDSYKNAMKYFDTVLKWTDRFGLDPYLVIAMIAQESSGNPNANGAAIGLMQWEKKNGTSVVANYVDDQTETLEFTNDELASNPDLQIQVGCAELKNRISDFEGNILVALQAYNLGTGGIKRTITHYITNGGTRNDSKGEIYFGVTDEEYMDYVYSGDNGWMQSLEWYKTTGYTVFGDVGGGDPDYLKHVLRYYNQDAAGSYTQEEQNAENIFEGTAGTLNSSDGRTYILYQQNKEPWSNSPYWGGTIKSSGCGPTSLSIIASGYGKNETPKTIADYIKNNKGNITSYITLSETITEKLKLKCKVYYEENKDNDEDYIEIIKENLKAKRPCVISEVRWNTLYRCRAYYDFA